MSVSPDVRDRAISDLSRARVDAARARLLPGDPARFESFFCAKLRRVRQVPAGSRSAVQGCDWVTGERRPTSAV
jgi:hypothetical protein